MNELSGLIEIIFPGSKIARNKTLGGRKLGGITNYGLKKYFLQNVFDWWKVKNILLFVLTNFLIIFLIVSYWIHMYFSIKRLLVAWRERPYILSTFMWYINAEVVLGKLKETLKHLFTLINKCKNQRTAKTLIDIY